MEPSGSNVNYIRINNQIVFVPKPIHPVSYSYFDDSSYSLKSENNSLNDGQTLKVQDLGIQDLKLTLKNPKNDDSMFVYDF